MKKLRLTDCKICNATYSPTGFSQHIEKTHRMTIEDYIVSYIYNGVHPTCACGCGKEVTIRNYQVMEYIRFHSPAGHFTPERVAKRNVETWKQNVTAGIRRYISEQQKIDPDFRKGKHNNFYGKSMSEERKQLIREAVERQIASGRHPFIGNMNGKLKGSSLEKKFEDFLITLGWTKEIEYCTNYKLSYLPPNKKAKRYRYYDFYIPHNNLLIEIHGRYWHPKTLDEARNEIQQKNFYNDQLKKELAKDNHYKLDIVYEDELDNYMNNFYTVMATRKDVALLRTVE